MFRNYIKIAFRNLLRNKGFSALNILGLSIGMASAVLILLWIQSEVTQNRFHEKIDRILLLHNRDSNMGLDAMKTSEKVAWDYTPKIMGPTMKQDYPEVEEAVRIDNGNTLILTVGDKRINADGMYVDKGFFNVFTFPLLEGNRASAINDNGIVLSEALALSLFGTKNALGKTVKVSNKDNFLVSGIVAKLPSNSSIEFDFLLPTSYAERLFGKDTDWGNNNIRTYVLLRRGASLEAFNRKINKITTNHLKSDLLYTNREVFARPFKDIWLYSKQENGVYVGGRIDTVHMFSWVAAFILIIACINFMNLSIARSEKRAKEVGMRKVVGAPKFSLIGQFMGESILLSFLAFFLAIAMVEISLPFFDKLVDKDLFISYGHWLQWMFALGFVVFVGILAGTYPAFYLSSFSPVTVLKGLFKATHRPVTSRKVLVVVQFVFAALMIISTLVVSRQINYAQNRASGYDRDNLAYVFMQGNIEKNYQPIRDELQKTGAVTSVTKTMSPITQRYSDGWAWSWTGSTEEDKKTDFVRMSADVDFVKTMGTELVEGRDINVYKFPSDSNAALLNETAVKAMHLKNAIGTVINQNGKKWMVVGVLKDFIYESPYEKVQQLVVFGPKEYMSTIHLKLNKANSTAKNLQLAEGVFKKFNPEYPFEYYFVDEAYADKFNNERRIGKLAGLFAGLTIFISCLGLFALAAYTAENRKKEIGVRKVLGASVLSVTGLLSADFLKSVLIAQVIASPLAWWFMSRWLSTYEYNIGVEWWIFLVTALLSLAIALVTVSFQSIRAALANPVKSLRSE